MKQVFWLILKVFQWFGSILTSIFISTMVCDFARDELGIYGVKLIFTFLFILAFTMSACIVKSNKISKVIDKEAGFEN